MMRNRTRCYCSMRHYGVRAMDSLIRSRISGLLEDLLNPRRSACASPSSPKSSIPASTSSSCASDPQRARLLFFRLCNNLLRRLSKTTNTFFAGKISMQISYICPVDERSAVNPGGRFNTSNVTIANDPPPQKVIEPQVKEEGEAEDDDVQMIPEKPQAALHPRCPAVLLQRPSRTRTPSSAPRPSRNAPRPP